MISFLREVKSSQGIENKDTIESAILHLRDKEVFPEEETSVLMFTECAGDNLGKWVKQL